MTHRTVIRLFSTTLIAALALGCGGDTPTGSVSKGLLEVDPLFAGIDEGTTQQLDATLNGTDAAVTWASSDETVATVSASGLVKGVAPGQASITASMTSDPTQIRSASITVLKVLGSPLTSGVAVTNVSSGTLEQDEGLLYHITVPPGATSLTVTFTGGTGDGDIYVQRAVPPDVSGKENPGCHSFNGGNDESCTVTNPQAGTWYVFVAVFDPYAGATLTATVTP
jgi:pre-peptidase/Big-like domain-containing protein